MKRTVLSVFVLVYCLSAAACRSSERAAASGHLIMAHYMPWFEADQTNARWGWHWTMNHYKPDHVTNGRPDLASHYTPLIGLYDSNDPHALECQALLMKYAGIDGVIIDWHGTDDYLDYGLVHRNTQRFIEIVKRAGLKFAICYEDQSVPQLISGKKLTAGDAVPHAVSMLGWMQAHWFGDPAYLKVDNRPVLLVFGNGYYQTDQWNQILAGLSVQPMLFTEAERRPPAVGAFDWPHPGGGTDNAFREMDKFAAAASGWPQLMSVAFPRFHDIYQEAGVQKSWGTIEDRDGKTYTETLERALKARIAQIATWNDWGEGTQIEPSVEYGYRDLETTQRLRKKYVQPEFAFNARALRLPVELYKLRKSHAGHAAALAKLDRAAGLLFGGSPDKADAIVKGMGR